MHLHFVGVGGTLMGHLAVLAKQAGHRVSGSDKEIYPPMDQVLVQHDIPVIHDWDLAALKPEVDLFVLGNAGLARGHRAVEYILDKGVRFVSGAQWLGESVLAGRWVVAVAGTHGKTTTTTMLAWILEQAGHNPGFMIGGVPENFSTSARLGEGPCFVVEADEYDTSYFDRQAKFLHYRPRTLIIGNLEYDHADIYPDLASIQKQFHLLLRAVPGTGLVILPERDDALEEVVTRGIWSPVERLYMGRRQLSSGEAGVLWQAEEMKDGFDLYLNDQSLGRVCWQLQGTHNVANALAAIAAARHVGVSPMVAAEALCSFAGVKRRLEQIGNWGHLVLYDDFAHHPTAIQQTLNGLKVRFAEDRIVAFIAPDSHTMKRGDLSARFADCTSAADLAVWYRHPDLQWSTEELVAKAPGRIEIADSLAALTERAVRWVKAEANQTVRLVCMSNQSFGGLVQQISKSCANLENT